MLGVSFFGKKMSKETSKCHFLGVRAVGEKKGFKKFEKLLSFDKLKRSKLCQGKQNNSVATPLPRVVTGPRRTYLQEKSCPWLQENIHTTRNHFYKL